MPFLFFSLSLSSALKRLSSVPEHTKPHMLNANVFLTIPSGGRTLKCASAVAGSRCGHKDELPYGAPYVAPAKVYVTVCLMW